MAPPVGRHSRRIAIVFLVILVLLPLATGFGVAQSVEGASGTIVVEEGETVDGIDAVAGTIVVRGTVTGDLSGAAGSIRITETGHVDGNVEAAAGTVIVDGAVGGDVRIGTGSFELTDTGRIGGSLDVGAGAINVDGTIDGNVRAAGESVLIGPNADVGGEFRYDADEFTRSADASVAGGIVEDTNLRGDTGGDFGMDLVPSWFGTVYVFAANLLLGGLLLVTVPRFSRDVAARIEDEPLATGGVGLVILFGVPILLALVAITIIGIPFALVGILAYAVAIWIASVYGKYAVGAWALKRTGRENRWLALVAGLAGFAVFGLVPFVGGLLEFLALLLGLGAFGFGLRERYQRREPTSESVDRSSST